jgi:hypothetical protein
MIEPARPAGELETAVVLDVAGRVLAEIEIVRIHLSHTRDQFLYVPEPGPNWAALQLSDRVLTLREIEPALVATMAP